MLEGSPASCARRSKIVDNGLDSKRITRTCPVVWLLFNCYGSRLKRLCRPFVPEKMLSTMPSCRDGPSTCSSSRTTMLYKRRPSTSSTCRNASKTTTRGGNRIACEVYGAEHSLCNPRMMRLQYWNGQRSWHVV